MRLGAACVIGRSIDPVLVMMREALPQGVFGCDYPLLHANGHAHTR